MAACGGPSMTLRPAGLGGDQSHAQLAEGRRPGLCVSSHPLKGWGPAGVSSPGGSSLPSDHHHPHCSPSRSVLRARVAAGAWPPEPRQGEAGAVGTVAVLPSPSPPNFPLGSQETEVKVAAGALGAGWPHSRWGELHDTYRRGAGSGLPAFVAGGLLVRAGRGFAGTGSGSHGVALQAGKSRQQPAQQVSCRAGHWAVPAPAVTSAAQRGRDGCLAGTHKAGLGRAAGVLPAAGRGPRWRGRGMIRGRCIHP